MAFKATSEIIRYDIEGAVDLGNNQGLSKVGALITAQTKAFLVPDSGLLRNSYMYRSRIKDGGFNDSSLKKAPESDQLKGRAEDGAVYIGSNVDYAVYEEFGTRNRGAKPALRPAVDVVTKGRDGNKAMADALNNSVNNAKIKSRRTNQS